ncbi:EcsC family protein [Paenibacillus guangzhouensis]|uniref:EcsC family protein n=1 Tax=Paenibacillus guangzhouensis TaxID=1473112 RepID=UPI0012669BE5|nr:EcsC family protein [Paenibacillus guangzhouensis]
METAEELKQALNGITKWEQEQRDLWIWDRIARFPFKILDRLTPKFIHEKIGKALDELGGYIQDGGKYLVSSGQIHQKLRESGDLPGNFPVDQLPLSVMDAVAKDLSDSRSTFATLQGATTGIGGIFTLAIDIPAILGLSLKVIQEIGLCYGFDPNSQQERIFTVKVMQFTSSDIVGKRAILDDMNAESASEYKDSEAGNATLSRIQGWREVMTVYRDNWGWKKLFQMVPIAGMVFGAWINRGMLQDVAEAAHMLYRKRRIQLRIAEMEYHHPE